MTAERVISLVIALIGALALFAAPVATVIVARINKRKDSPEPEPPPIVRGQTIDFQAKTVELLEQRIDELKAENERLRKERPAD